MVEANVWPAQAKQNEGSFTLIIDESTDCLSFLDNEKIRLTKSFWIKHCGTAEVPLRCVLKKEAELNNVSFERCLLSLLLSRRYELLELEVEFWDREREQWGVCSWYKQHSLYSKPVAGYEKMHPKWTPFIRSMFKTKNAGDQEFTLFSMQMIGAALIGKSEGILLHKTLLFRKAAFSSPQRSEGDT